MISLKPCPFCGNEDIHTPTLISSQLAKCPKCGGMAPLNIWNERYEINLDEDFDKNFDAQIFEEVRKDDKETCQRTIIDKDWTGHTQRKCGRTATHCQDDGLPLCGRHYNKWDKKRKAHR